jgi:hypothetical protein
MINFWALSIVVIKQIVLGRTNRLLSFDTTRTEERTTLPAILLFLRVFAAAVMILPSRCLATITRYTYRHTDWWVGFMKNAAQMSSGAIIIIRSFIKNVSSIQKLMGGQTYTHRQPADVIRLLWFLKNMESRLIKTTTIYNVQNIDHSSLTVHFILLYAYVYCLCCKWVLCRLQQ